MKKIIITIAIISMIVPATAWAAPITVVQDWDAVEAANANFNCDPYNMKIVGTYSSGTRACTGDYGILKRLYNLEVAVQELQTKNAALEAKIGATGAAPASIEARVSDLERVTKAIQDSLVMVVNMLAEALSSLKH